MGCNFNRYWYAKDNPYKYIDPDGRTCKKAGNDGYSCTVDDNAGKWSRSALKTVNRTYTQAVNILLKHPGATAKIEVDGKSFTVSAKTVAKALIGTWVVTGNGHPRSRADTLGGTLTPNRGHNGSPKTTLSPSALSYRQIWRNCVHRQRLESDFYTRRHSRYIVRVSNDSALPE